MYAKDFIIAALLPSILFTSTVGQSCVCSGFRSPQTLDCTRSWAAPDDCNCTHWGCSEQQDNDNGLCPPDFHQYLTDEGTALCIYISGTTHRWETASANCDNRFNSDLLNIRTLEELLESSSNDLYKQIMVDIANFTGEQALWVGLHLLEDKLYWDSPTPSPDRDRTSFSDSMVIFNGADWNAVRSGRDCMMLQSRPHAIQTLGTLTPQYCFARLPYACSKVIPSRRQDFFTPNSVALCEPGWTGSLEIQMCYRYNSNLLTYDDAKQQCTDGGDGHLVDPRRVDRQRFITGLLTKIPANQSPLTVFVGMRIDHRNNLTVLALGESVNVDTLDELNIGMTDTSGLIESLGWNSGDCGVYWSEVYAEGRRHSKPFTFGDCSQRRPSICAKAMPVPTYTNQWHSKLSYSNFTLTCTFTGIAGAGKIIWLRNQQYFLNQPHTGALVLDQTNFKYLIDDNSDREISHTDMTGNYSCEFWQIYPKRIYKSSQVAVSFADTIDLRMYTTLDIPWQSDYEASNYRVSQSQETPDEVLPLYNLLKTKVMETLAGVVDTGLNYTVNVVQISPTDNGLKVKVEYTLKLNGDVIARINRDPENTDLEDVMILARLYDSLQNASLGDPDSTSPIDVQTSIHNMSVVIFQCPERSVEHPNTGELFLLPVTGNGSSLSFNGFCHNISRTMVIARCIFTASHERATWSIEMTECPVHCTAGEINHDSTGQSLMYEAANHTDERLEIWGYDCAGKNSSLISGQCYEDGWHFNQMQCSKQCQSGSLVDGQLPISSVNVGQTFVLKRNCSGSEMTILEADCVLNVGNLTHPSRWVNTTTWTCDAHCSSQGIDHDSQQIIFLPRGEINERIEVEGFCDGVATPLVSAECVGSISAGLAWNFTIMPCILTCPLTVYTHPVTNETANVPSTPPGDRRSLQFLCNGINSTLFATCVGNHTHGVDWKFSEVNCFAKCPSLSIQSDLLPTDTNLAITELHGNVTIEGVCENRTVPLIRATCIGDLRTGVEWQTYQNQCNISCSANSIVHPDTYEDIHISSLSLNSSAVSQGMCNGKRTELIHAECVGSLKEGAELNYIILPCHVTCSESLYTHSVTNETYNLPVSLPGNIIPMDFQCNGYNLIINATCSGNTSQGVAWTFSDTPPCEHNCPSFAIEFDGDSYTIPETEFGVTAVIPQVECAGIPMPLMAAECGGNLQSGVEWVKKIAECNATCEESNIIHPNTHQLITVPALTLGSNLSFDGLCNGHNMTLVTANCAGSKRQPQLEIANHVCHYGCDAEPIVVNTSSFNFTESAQRFFNQTEPGDLYDYILPRASLNETHSQQRDCAGVQFDWLTATCLGDPQHGGQWEWETHDCSVDPRCAEKRFFHADTYHNLLVPTSEIGTQLHLYGKCGETVIPLINVSCHGVLAQRGQWSIDGIASCTSSLMDKLNNLFDDLKDDPKELASQFASLTNDAETITDSALDMVGNMLQFLSDPERPKDFEEEGPTFLNVVSNVMKLEGSRLDKPKNDSGGTLGLSIVNSIESFASSAEITAATFTIEQKNLMVQVMDNAKLGDKDLGVNYEDNEFKLSSNITKGERIVMVMYTATVLFPSRTMTVSNDVIIGASVVNKTINNTEGAVLFTSGVNITESESKMMKCGYWDNEDSDWSTRGCETTFVNGSITCSCNHLTNFAILLDVQGQENYISEEHHQALSIISMVGLCISIAALSLHILSFLAIFKLRQNQFQKVLANLSLSILLTNIVFVVGIDKTSSTIGCIAVAVMLHYFILVSFAWMFIEAFMQYRRFVVVFKIHVSRILLKAGLPAWLLPAIPPAIILIYDPYLYKGGDRFCWMKTEALYYAVLLPIACVIVANIILFVLILRGLTCSRPQKLRTNKSESHMAQMYFKAGVAVFTLLGLTWIFGFFAISDARLPFQYLFCIFNSFQGLVIFIVHNIRDPKVQNWWRRVLHLKTKKGVVSSSSKTHSTTITYSHTHHNSSKFSSTPQSVPPLQDPKHLTVTPLTKYNALKAGHDKYYSTESDTSNAASDLTTSSEVTATSDV